MESVKNVPCKFFIETARKLPSDIGISILSLGIIEIQYTDKDEERKRTIFFSKFKN